MVRYIVWLHQWKFPCTASTGEARGTSAQRQVSAGGGALRAEVRGTNIFGEVQTDAESIQP